MDLILFVFKFNTGIQFSSLNKSKTVLSFVFDLFEVSGGIQFLVEPGYA